VHTRTRRVRTRPAPLTSVARLTSVAVLALAALVSLSGPARADTATTRCMASDPFTATLAQQLAASYPGRPFSGSVHDERTGCQYDLHPEERNGTASVLKVEIMAGILLRAQSQGRGLTPSEASQILPMITRSDNTAATSLWESLGAAPGMANLDSVFGMSSTTPASPLWGLTSTSAADQVRLLRQVLLGDYGPLSGAYRTTAFDYMTSVIPSQRWGITAGVPAGWTVANKNGFAPRVTGGGTSTPPGWSTTHTAAPTPSPCSPPAGPTRIPGSPGSRRSAAPWPPNWPGPR